MSVSDINDCPTSNPLHQPHKGRYSHRSSITGNARRNPLNHRESFKNSSRHISNRHTQTILNNDPDDQQEPEWMNQMEDRYFLQGTGQQKKRLNQSMLVSKRKWGAAKDFQISSVKKEPQTLKKIIRQFKTAHLVNTFSTKMKRGLTRKIPIGLQEEDSHDRSNMFIEWLKHQEGIQLPSFLSTLLSIFGILSISFLTLAYSLSIVFQEVQNTRIFRAIQFFSLIEYFVHIFFSFTLKRYRDGSALVYLNEIAMHYFQGRFIVDLANATLVLTDLIVSDPATEFQYFRWLILFKLPEVLEKLQIIENLYINSFYREQYWGLLNVLIINLTFAHVLSILLNGMAHLNQNSNWLKEARFAGANWFECYVWGYYWGTTIMLTVGFGDIAATNSMEAGCLIFIEMFSCITLAYNINCVGNLVNNLRQQQVEKNNNLKTFQMMVKSNEICRELQNKINNYIEESCLIKNQFNFQEQDQLLEALPAPLRREYLNSVNKKLFDSLPFLKDLTLQSKNNLAQSIVRRVTHPYEIILSKGEPEHCMILSKGILGLTIKRSAQHKNPTCVIQTMQVSRGQKCKLLTLGFVPGSRLPYTIKSLSYSVLYWLSNEDMTALLRQNNIDYEHFCLQRDKHHISIDSFELYQCQNCVGEFHNKFNCPRLHYIPIRSTIILRYLKKLKNNKQVRDKQIRYPQKNINPLSQLDVVTRQLKIFRSQAFEWDSYSRTDTISDPSILNEDRPSARSEEMTQTATILDAREQRIRHFPERHVLDPEMLLHFVTQQRESEVAFWYVETDQLHNWHYYFPADNPDQLKSKRYRIRRALSP